MSRVWTINTNADHFSTYSRLISFGQINWNLSLHIQTSGTFKTRALFYVSQNLLPSSL